MASRSASSSSRTTTRNWPETYAEEAYLDQLLSAGYELRVRDPGHRMVRTPTRDVHVHVLEVGDEAADDYLLLRNHLRTDAEDRDLYERTKRALIEQQWADMNACAEAKTEVIDEIKERARTSHAQPSRNVDATAEQPARHGDRRTTPRQPWDGARPGLWPSGSGTARVVSNAVVVSEDDVERDTWSDPIRGDVGFRTLFGGGVRTTDFTAGVAELEAGGWLGHHRHEPAEIYYVLSGEGSLSIDGRDHPVRAGTGAYIPGNSEHAIRNTGDDALRFFYAFAVGSFEDIEYSFTATQ